MRINKLIITASAITTLMVACSGSALADDDSIMDVDDNAAAFSGAWPRSTSRILYYGDDYQFAIGTNSSSITAEAIFTTAATLDVTGRYQVFVRWTTHPNRASNARYRIYDGPADNTINGSCYKDQRVNGGAWHFCSEVNLTSGRKAVVKLGNNANGVVVADAVRLVRVSVDSGDIVNGSITGTDIATGTITSSDIASNTIVDTDIRDEPGVEYSNASSRNIATISTNPSSKTNLTSFTLSAPTSGYVIVNAFGWVDPETAHHWVRPCISNISGGSHCSSWAPIIESNTTGNYENEKRYALTNVYTVSPGSTTYYLKANRSSSATGTIAWEDFYGIFVPTRY